MIFYHNLLPIGEKHTDPPEKETNSCRNALLDEYESILREIFTIEQEICDFSSKERAPYEDMLAQYINALDIIRDRLSQHGCIL